MLPPGRLARPMAVAGTVNILAAGPVSRVAELAAMADRLGFTRCWLYDEGLHTRDVHVALTAVAARTQRVLIGPGVTNPYTRHPGVTAAAIATLDEHSRGRAFVGLGAGGALTLGPLGLERRQPAETIAGMVATMRRLFAGEVVDHRGGSFSYRKARLAYARPDIEIWVAGRGRRVLEVGGRLADGVHLSYLHKDTIGEAVERVRAASGGRRPRLSYSTLLATSEEAVELARTHLGFRIVDSAPRVKELLGIGPEETEGLRAALAAGGPEEAGRLVRRDWVDRFVIVGSPGQCASELAALADRHGIDEFQVPLHELDLAEAAMTEAAAVLARI